MSRKKKKEGSLKIPKVLPTKVVNTAIINHMIREGRTAKRTLDRNSKEAVRISNDLLMKLLNDNKDTEYGRKYDFANIHSIEEYQDKVPLCDYDTLEPYIKRMVENDEENLLSCERPVHYALSSGSVGVPKHIPVSAAELAKYRRYGTSMCFGVVDEYYRNTTGKSFKKGFVADCLELKFQETAHGIPKGAISGNILKQVKDTTQYFVSPPWDVLNPKAEMDLKYLRARYVLERRNIVFLNSAFMTALVDLLEYSRSNWEMLCNDIACGTIDSSIEIPDDWREKFESQLKPNPERAKELAAAFKKGPNGMALRIWPDLQFVASIGTGGFFTYSKKMHTFTGKNIPFNHLGYAASEGFFATSRHVGDSSFVLVPDGGFYEFIPAKSEDDSVRPLTIDQLEEGELYELVLTNLSGFYRYRIKDVIRVTGFYNEAPMLEFVFRKSQLLSIAGEKTNEEAIRWSIEQFMKDASLDVTDYSVYADTDEEPGHYTFFIEPDRVIRKEELPEMRDKLEARVMQANPSYGEKIRTGVLAPCEIIPVQQQTYQLYREMMIMKGVSPNQLKPVRVIDTPIKYRFFNGLRERYE
ncbi:GH3 auxin-responsive promoter family protein [Eubacterium sp. AB3007]|uniref:GH3 auxin-responsive promoter family protein n=1 Tax=Eubacterium sp. AB3007 TaxID=1392487 RepID=UPI000481D100|nr:GH3 auxin-responsive promoter family protein [Eubacterium sp. AB3007]